MGFGAALSATEASLFVVGGQEIATGNLPGDVWRYDVPSGSWTHLALTGTRPERVLSAIYRPNDAALYLLDQARARDGERARLLRIDLSTRRSTELGSWPRTAKWDRTYLSNTADNRLLLVSSSSLTNELTGVAFDPAGDLTRSSGPSFLSFQSRGSLLVQPTLTEKGLTLPIADRAGVKNFFSAIDDLMASPGSQRNLIAECL